MKKNRHIMKEVEEGSIAWELELEPGDELLSINGKTIEDVFDYHYLVNDEYIVLLVKKADGEEWELEVTDLWTNTGPVRITVSSVSLIKCLRG